MHPDVITHIGKVDSKITYHLRVEHDIVDLLHHECQRSDLPDCSNERGDAIASVGATSLLALS